MIFAPFGLRPVGYASASVWNGRVSTYALLNTNGAGVVTYATSLYAGDPVTIANGGSLIHGHPIVQQAADTGVWLGAFKGVNYVDTNGQAVYSNKWVASTPVKPGTEILVEVIDDRDVIFEIQAANDGPAVGGVTAAQIMDNANFGQVAQWTPNLATGISGAFLRTGTIANTSTFPMKIVGLGAIGGSIGTSDNALGVNYNIVLVKPNQHVFVTGTQTGA